MLAKRSPEDHTLLGVRDLDRGKAAIDKLRKNGVKSSLGLVEIDITSDESIRAAESDVRSRFGNLDSRYRRNTNVCEIIMLTYLKS